MSGRRRFAGWLGVFALLPGAESGFSAPPTADALVPSGGQAGTEVPLLTVVGKMDPWPCQAWCSNPEVKFSPGEKAGQFKVSIGKGAKVGPCLVRIHNAEGASEPRTFVVTQLREIIEDETANENPAQAIAVGALPVVVNGRLDKSQDFDAWKVSLKKGQTLSARLDGYALRSGIDPFLHLYDSKGVRLALESDGPTNLDPRMEFTAEADGDYVVAVMAIDHPPSTSVSFSGSAKGAYRLTMAIGDLKEDAASVGDGEAPGPDSLPPGATVASVPLSGFGTLEKAGEADRVLFSAKKGSNLLIELDAVDHGFPTDTVLILEKPDGSVIREVDDDKASRDASYVFKVPADGEYVCRITDRFGRGGKAIRYFLKISEESQDFTVSSEQLGMTVKAGESVQWKVKIERQGGHAVALVATAKGLPSGVTAEPLKLDGKKNEGTLEIKCGKEA
ncbi:MAG: PPC domain-containing protein, partial [Verrucomicrobiae bacterium]|nr:PPC domain-containing protein [Verrucomicrobiae bacterium]